MTQRVFNLADLFEVVVDACPDRLALVAGEVRLTYRELDERANRVAHAFISAGLATGAHIGIYSRNRAEWLEAMIGAFKARMVPININYRYVEDELRYIVDNADLAGLVVERGYLPKVAAVRDDVPKLAHVFVLADETAEALGSESAEGAADGAADGAAGEFAEGAAEAIEDAFGAGGVFDYEAALAAESGARDFGQRSPEDRYMVYTGGTTGFPKGVEWRSHDIFCSAMGGGNFGGEPIADPELLAAKAEGAPLVQMLTTPLMHGNGQWVTWITLFSAGTAVMWTGLRYDPAEILRMVEREGCVTMMLVGDAMARPIADALESGEHRVETLKVIGSGGALLSPAVKAQLTRLIPGLYIADSFGASEFGAGSSQTPGGRFPLKPKTAVLGEDLRPVGVGESGRIARTGYIPIGYYKDPVKTADTFHIDPDGVRWVIPGDFARVEDDGDVTLLGRGSVCINTGGEKVFPEEVEGVLKAHPAVYDAVVVGVPDPRFGERVAAVVSLRPNHTLTTKDLAEHAREQLAGYKIPRDLVTVVEVPRTPAGKPDYRWAKETAVGALGG
ncbi:acyl-CoA synthetase [Embleya scabrispora]|uniref:acyl-CoA synthetase n=1 Tax=Embleya scabrispora TaxID=159449 RepID=UPI00037230D2|nr:acyl-CoA synthetase [Embleya scabrispora]MYS83248.1 AMP-binding protein [Streptomyces sp. SID5474]